MAGISVKEHLEVNVVPLNVCLTSRFYQTMQDFFFPKAEDLPDLPEPDHSHLFGFVGSEGTVCNDISTATYLSVENNLIVRENVFV